MSKNLNSADSSPKHKINRLNGTTPEKVFQEKVISPTVRKSLFNSHQETSKTRMKRSNKGKSLLAKPRSNLNQQIDLNDDPQPSTSTDPQWIYPHNNAETSASVEESSQIIDEAQPLPDPRTSDRADDEPEDYDRDAPDNRGDTEPLVEFIQEGEIRQTVNNDLLRTTRRADFKFKHNLMDLKDLLQFHEAIDNAFGAAVESLLSGVDENARVAVQINHPRLNDPIFIHFKDFNNETFLHEIYKVHQSRKEFILDGVLSIRVYIVDRLEGGVRTSKKPVTYDNVSRKMTSIIKVKANDNSCGFIAIYLAMQYLELCPDGKATKTWQNLIKSQDRLARGGRGLADWFELPFNQALTVTDFTNTIQPILEDDYQIFIVNGNNGELMFKGPNSPNRLYLLWSKEPGRQIGHFDMIKEIRCLFNRSLWCADCFKFFDSPLHHKCPEGCDICRSKTKCIENRSSRDCDKCKRHFLNINCYQRHLDEKICDKLRKCTHCEIEYRVKKSHPHECDTFHCNECKEWYSVQPHYCYLNPLNLEKLIKEDKNEKIISCFDIETMVSRDDNTDTHTPNMLCSMTVCPACCDSKLLAYRENKDNEYCNVCKQFYHCFRGTDCVTQYIAYLFDTLSVIAHENKTSVRVFAHNLSGFDGCFVLRELAYLNVKNVDPILSGTKIMKIDVGNIRFLDSLLFFHLPLSALPKALGFEDVEKGKFPYLLNTVENQNMDDCPLSDISLGKFGIEYMTKKNADDLESWYYDKVEEDYVFSLWRDLEHYCKNDVYNLTEAVTRYQQLNIKVQKLDPFTRCCTLASVGLENFRAHYLKEETITVSPTSGYSNKRKQSIVARAWLDHIEHFEKKKLIREYRVVPYYADAIWDQPFTDETGEYRKVAYEYNGCHWHGCDVCGVDQPHLKLKRERRLAYFAKRNIKVVTMQHCVFNDEWRYNSDDWISQSFILRRIEFWEKVKADDLYAYPRKALHGGRTNNIRFTFKKSDDPNISMEYKDFVSIYPTVQSQCRYPIKLPTIFSDLKPTDDLTDFNGLICCKILPPKNLRFPVLPYLSKGKLLFPLCRTCSNAKKNNSCYCDEDERCITGVFTSPEIHKALERGYVIIDIYEVVHFPEMSDEIFKEYIKIWYKIKTEASGFPKGLNTEEEKIAWFEKFVRDTGVEIEYRNIKYNPGLRFIAKFMLNTLWGKLCQRPNQPQSKIVKSYFELWNIIDDKRFEILGEIEIGDMILLSYRFVDESMASARNTSSVIGAFVTDYARLRLLEEIEKIERSFPDSVYYMDTDSVFYLRKPGTYEPQSGSYLGQMTNEIIEEYGEGAYITKFYTTGPKSYMYEVEYEDSESNERKTAIKLKAKGLTQILKAEATLNAKTLIAHSKARIKGNDKPPTKVPQQVFRRSKNFVIETRRFNKQFKCTSDKRRVIGNNTVPFGWVDTNEDMEAYLDGIVNENNPMYNYEGQHLTLRQLIRNLGRDHPDIQEMLEENDLQIIDY